ncbi:MAG: hypothetical protein GXP32_05655 [Kiritimatiellaeota bacterium]|nr:hypothetical protein [Kiritimatiellota bacterium]
MCAVWHELFNGETNYPFIADRIEKAGYDAYFGLEYMPLLESVETLTRTLELFKYSNP